ncbi:hypothetical protein MFRU_010g00940 [Monilinia fructicola]|nr:hypothetical protein MFRU_010g00940 [Monilinia fructicola]
MPWPNSLSQHPPGTSADDDKDKVSTPLPKAPSNTDEEPRDHDAAPTTPSSSTNTRSLSSSKPLVEKILALTSEPLSHGGAWSSPAQNQKPSDRPKYHEEVYIGIGEYHPKSGSELAHERRLMWKRKTNYLSDEGWDEKEATIERRRLEDIEETREIRERIARYGR